MRAIGEKALPLLEAVNNPTIEDHDWVACWLESARNVSDDDIQRMWARILAGRAEDDGSFSKWTLHAVAQMSKVDVENWTKFASCLWEFNDPSDTVPCYWLRASGKVLGVHEQMLTNGGLLTFEGNYAIRYREFLNRAPVAVRYFGQLVVLEVPEKDDMHIPTGHVTLTPTAREVLSLCDAEPNVAYRMDCLEQWKKAGIRILEA